MSTVSEPRAGSSATRPEVEQLQDAVRQLFGAERRLRGREQVPGELTHVHIRSLFALSQAGEMTAGQLARSADLNPASMTAMLDHLEELEIVRRERSTTDRRVCNVSLTPKGAELVTEKTERWRALWRERLAGFSDAEIDGARRVISELTALFDGIVVERESDRAGAGEPA